MTLLCALVLGQVQSQLDAMDARMAEALKNPAAVENQATWQRNNDEALELIVKDQLKDASDFRRVSKHIQFSQNTFVNTQAKYETLLTALALGDSEARKLIGEAWDTLMVGLSRERRIGVQPMPKGFGSERWKVKLTSKSILAVYRGEVKPDSSTKDNTEVKAIVDADQKARERDWSKLTMKDYELIAQEDAKRLKRIKQLLNQGSVKTANDFDNAALVCQHGETFGDYVLAHELSVSAMILGKKSAAWLAGASYDRMLINCGLPQRFGTQYSIFAGVTKFTRHDPEVINDTERKAVVGRTLAESMGRKF